MTTHLLKTASLKAKTQEIFSSIQGEGIYWGERQIFIRFFGCNMKCVYCDEPGTLLSEDSPEASYTEEGVEELLREVASLEKTNGPHHSISLTGGEPLVQEPFLLSLAPALKRQGFRLYLETNGALPERLERMIPFLDIIAMDIKPPTATGERPFWEAHRRFLEIGQRKTLFVKIVVTRETLEEEIAQAVSLIAEINPSIPLVLQPVTPFGKVAQTVPPQKLAVFLALARERLRDVRVLEQLHKTWGVP